MCLCYPINNTSPKAAHCNYRGPARIESEKRRKKEIEVLPFQGRERSAGKAMEGSSDLYLSRGILLPGAAPSAKPPPGSAEFLI